MNNIVLKELLLKIPKDKTRKVCKNCNELGHSITSVSCKINIEKNNKLREKIKKYILIQNCLDDKTIDEYCVELASSLDISANLCKSLYSEIPFDDLFERKIDISVYIENIRKSSEKCSECHKDMFCIQSNTHRIWKCNKMCDVCWYKYKDDRLLLWDMIKAYKPIICEICSKIQECIGDRYHYDHLNMFNKNKSICSMVDEGFHIQEIYNEIDKCHILCLSCHHIITDIERKLGFTRIKQTLTYKLNQNEITEEDYNKQTLHYQNIYEKKMITIYNNLKTFV
jgi:hypothetical protein